MTTGRSRRLESKPYLLRQLLASTEPCFQFDMPPFQRDYSWGPERWRDLWRDIARKYSARRRVRGNEHFLGVLLLQEVRSQDRGLWPVQVVDGQQRLLTCLAILTALRDHGAPISDMGLDPFRTRGRARWSGLKPDTLEVVDALEHGQFEAGFAKSFAAHPLAQAYRFFRLQLAQGQGSDPDAYIKAPGPRRRGPEVEPWPSKLPGRRAWDLRRMAESVVDHLIVVGIHLPPEEQEATGVFESLNGANTPLSEFDKVRVLMYGRTGGRTGSYATDFVPIEERLLATSYRGKVKSIGDQFLYEFTLANFKSFWRDDRPAAGRTHEAFKEFALRAAPSGNLRAFKRRVLDPTARAARIFPLAVAAEEALGNPPIPLPPQVALALRTINGYSSGPPTPLIMRILLSQSSSQHSKLKQLHLIEAALIRATLARVKLTTLRSEMIRLLDGTPEDASTAQLEASLAALLERMQVPSDADLAIRAGAIPIYEGTMKSSRTSLTQLLRSFEHVQLKNVTNLLLGGQRRGAYTIEHIFPQSARLPASWKSEFRSWGRSSTALAEVHAMTHCLGNLVLVIRADNSGFGTRSFTEKKKLLKESTQPLLMYGDIVKKRQWTAEQIETRGRHVANQLMTSRAIRRL